LHRDATAGSQRAISALSGPEHVRSRLPGCC
jgi:hypothetical protein